MRTSLYNPVAWLAFTGMALLLTQPAEAQFNRPTAPTLAEGAARLVALEGAVSIQKAGSLWALNVGDTIQVQQVVVTGADGYARFEVADGSTFEVFPSSKVTFRNNPGDWRDLVDVWLGRIRVHIQKLGGLPNPNRVQTPTAIISVRGTVFDVAVTDDDETTTVSVAEGQVAVMHRLMHREGGIRLLNAGDEIVVYRNVPLAAGRWTASGRCSMPLKRFGRLCCELPAWADPAALRPPAPEADHPQCPNRCPAIRNLLLLLRHRHRHHLLLLRAAASEHLLRLLKPAPGLLNCH